MCRHLINEPDRSDRQVDASFPEISSDDAFPGGAEASGSTRPACGNLTGVEHRARALGLLAVFTAVMCFAISFSVIKWPGVPGSVIAWWRLIGSSILWWTVLVVRKRRTGTPLPSRRTWRIVTVPAIFFGLQISVLFTAVTRTSVAHSEFIMALGPLLLIPLGYVVFHERPYWPALRWGLLSLAGIAIVLFVGSGAGVATWQGDLLTVVALVFFVSYLLASKWARQRGADVWETMAIVMPLALIPATPIAVTLAGDEMWPLPWQAWVSVGILSVLTGMVGHGLLFYAQKSVPIATISTIQVSQPALSVFWAWLLLGEQISALQVPGMIMVMTGLVLVVWSTQRAPDRAVAAAPAASG